MGLANSNVDWDSVKYFSVPEEKRVQISFKVPAPLKAQLLAVVRLWKLKARAEGASQEAVDAIDMTYVCERMLRVGIDGIWSEAGAPAGLKGMPSSDEEWAAFERAILKDAKKK